MKHIRTILLAFMSSLTAIAQDCPDSCELYIPNCLTPDCDSFNCGVLEVVSNCSFQSYHLTIFDRWGETLFDSYNPTDLFNSADYMEGTYFWKFTGAFCNGSSINQMGNLTILR